MPKKDSRQTFMFSATFPAPIQKLASEFLNTYIWVRTFPQRLQPHVASEAQSYLHVVYALLNLFVLLVPCVCYQIGVGRVGSTVSSIEQRLLKTTSSKVL